jgi:hypothetical protein
MTWCANYYIYVWCHYTAVTTLLTLVRVIAPSGKVEVDRVPPLPTATYTPLLNVKALIELVPNPDVLGVQVVPSVDIIIVPPIPAATYTPLPKVKALILLVPNPDVLLVQVTASVEVVKTPPAPPATYMLLAKVKA